MQLIKHKIIKKLVWTFVILFILMNVIAIFHSYKFTHFAESKSEKTKTPAKLSTIEKISTILFGVNNPKPINKKKPSITFETIYIQSNKEIECWDIKTSHSKGTIILFHGYGGNKSSMLDKAEVFRDLGFNTFLVDFMGSGGSEGNQTTIGFLEAEQVKSSYEYVKQIGEKNIFLFGTSMGAVAIMKAISDFEIKPKGIIIECPFGSMYKTVGARFESMNVPTFPMAGLLVFWGGIQNGFWGFGHNSTDYSKNITIPTLLMHGKIDKKVSLEEIDEIFLNLKGQKELKIYENAGHENYLIKYKDEWTHDISEFLSKKLQP
ncbi:alpha/beta hydrolase [Flavobacterium piscinae]|uniref:Alpha/beta hydrolase n=2 Tax=Flavobacterium piscinae TaxID=2506424 RepID=A0A4Q1KL03_9FLAO|nr:alpha/beta hydrolase [Flavobacterium piscinae]